MVLHSLLAAEALFVIIKHRSISSFEIYNSDFGVKLAMALCYSIKQQPTGAWATLSVVIFRFLAEYSDN